ncbi:MAG: MerR family transcriptional regulator [Syntrophomonadaceae bacterium]|nr:MerR family transcriptional regulator [Syntrophomonadaceae bacterium]
MSEVFYKIGEVAEMLGIEQHTLRYLEHALRLKIKRDERSDRLYSEADLDTLRLIIKLKTEKGLNTTAIRMALGNLEESQETAVAQPFGSNNIDIYELTANIRRIVEQNDELLQQNQALQQRIEELEYKINKRDEKREERIDELIKIWRKEQEDRNKSWLSKLTRK